TSAPGGTFSLFGLASRSIRTRQRRAPATFEESIGMAKKPAAPPKKTKRPAPESVKKTKPAAVADTASPQLIKQVLGSANGILRLAPTWVPRSFLMPGRRLKLHPADLYALGAKRGGIDERWFASTTAAANEGAPWDEGLSYVVHNCRKAFTLREAFNHEAERRIGPMLW